MASNRPAAAALEPQSITVNVDPPTSAHSSHDEAATVTVHPGGFPPQSSTSAPPSRRQIADPRALTQSISVGDGLPGGPLSSTLGRDARSSRRKRPAQTPQSAGGRPSTLHRKFWLRFNPRGLQKANIRALVEQHGGAHYVEGVAVALMIVVNGTFIIFNTFSALSDTGKLREKSAQLFQGYYESVMIQVWLEAAVMGTLLLSLFLHVRTGDVLSLKKSLIQLSGFSTLVFVPSIRFIKKYWRSLNDRTAAQQQQQQLSASFSQHGTLIASAHRRNPNVAMRLSRAGGRREKGGDQDTKSTMVCEIFFLRLLFCLVVPWSFVIPMLKLFSIQFALTSSPAMWSATRFLSYLAIVNQIAYLRDATWREGASEYLFRTFAWMPDIEQREKDVSKFSSRVLWELIDILGWWRGFLFAVSISPEEEAFIAHYRDISTTTQSSPAAPQKPAQQKRRLFPPRANRSDAAPAPPSPSLPDTHRAPSRTRDRKADSERSHSLLKRLSGSRTRDRDRDRDPFQDLERGERSEGGGSSRREREKRQREKPVLGRKRTVTIAAIPVQTDGGDSSDDRGEEAGDRGGSGMGVGVGEGVGVGAGEDGGREGEVAIDIPDSRRRDSREPRGH
ncbi:unnamed protein product [Vitrella brassicaformis CCMP3155]|uniref:Uncharacterized protein n=3 Tax=Vitrella brassicaformis TaxID=1169539 RepID=A0A0G4FXJ4_VITBC|nr:unnamed protein product [Vitrella brassicaformis CCMP3155]|eukprot:CEM20031.1 unnamed protein product [Vitrella brassicaformis CCMP3155]